MDRTPYLQLPLFGASDHPSILQDWNDTVTKLDNAYANMSPGSVPEIAQSIANLQTILRNITNQYRTGRLDVAEDVINSLSLEIAPDFDPDHAYAVGDIVCYASDQIYYRNPGLFRFTSTHTAGDPWDVTECETITVAQVLDQLADAIANLPTGAGFSLADMFRDDTLNTYAVPLIPTLKFEYVGSFSDSQSSTTYLIRPYIEVSNPTLPQGSGNKKYFYTLQINDLCPYVTADEVSNLNGAVSNAYLDTKIRVIANAYVPNITKRRDFGPSGEVTVLRAGSTKVLDFYKEYDHKTNSLTGSGRNAVEIPLMLPISNKYISIPWDQDCTLDTDTDGFSSLSIKVLFPCAFIQVANGTKNFLTYPPSGYSQVDTCASQAWADNWYFMYGQNYDRLFYKDNALYAGAETILNLFDPDNPHNIQNQSFVGSNSIGTLSLVLADRHA